MRWDVLAIIGLGVVGIVICSASLMVGYWELKRAKRRLGKMARFDG